MNEFEFKGFLKAAKEQGASGQDVSDLIKEATGENVDPQMLEQLMAQTGQGQGAPSPGAGAPPSHDPTGGAGVGGPPGADPMAALMGGAGGPPTGQPGGELPLSEEQINELAALIAQHLSQQGGGSPSPHHSGHPHPHHDPAAAQQNPMAGLPPEAQEGLEMAKSSEYIGEFLKCAMENGATVEQAVDIYTHELNKSIEFLKEAAVYNEEVIKVAKDTDEETLSYYQGLFEKAAESGLSYEDTLQSLVANGYGEKLKQEFNKK